MRQYSDFMVTLTFVILHNCQLLAFGLILIESMLENEPHMCVSILFNNYKIMVCFVSSSKSRTRCYKLH
jgi:hypothetical protein